MKHLILLALSSSLLTLSAAVPLKWTVETSRLAPAVFDVVRGETIALEAAFNSAGKPFAMDGEPVSIFWQTNGMGNAWWTAPAAAESNSVSATFTPEMDPGATTVNGFLGSSGSIYRAAFTFRFRHGPGAVPNTLPLPVPVIDFAKVKVLNPPWESGGGVNTNAVIDIIHEQLATNGIRSVDGAARPLPKYLHALDFDDNYPEDAAWYYAQPQDYGLCSSVSDGGFLYRNYDWKFDDAAEFVVKVSCSSSRFASVGVANVGTNLTEEIVTSGKWSRYYKCLPGRVVDGINENGVVAEVNVVDGEPQWGGGVSPALHPLAAVRWILDHATNAQHAATYIASHIAFPSGWTQNFHYMIADATSTYIVENGGYAKVDGELPVLTNFLVLMPDEGSTPVYSPETMWESFRGEGKERFDLLNLGANITNAWFTRAYLRTTNWESDFKDAAEMEAAKVAWETHGREELRGKGLWQTVHTSVYDITNRVLRICVQERPDWYTFAVPSAGGVKPEAVREIVEPMIGDATNGIPEQIAALQSGKRDKTDLTVYEKAWSPEHSGLYSGIYWMTDPDYSDLPCWVCDYNSEETLTMGGDYLNPNATSLVFPDGTETHLVAVPSQTDTLAKASEVADALSSKQDALTSEQLADIAAVPKKADEFTKWSFDGSDVPPNPSIKLELRGSPDMERWGYAVLLSNGVEVKAVMVTGMEPRDGWEDEVFYAEFIDHSIELSCVATRKRVLRTGDAATPQELTAAISTNNPAFVSAVRNTPTSGMPEDMPTDWGTYGTVGAALAALAAGLKWCKNILGTLASGYSTFADWIASMRPLTDNKCHLTEDGFGAWSCNRANVDASNLRWRQLSEDTWSWVWGDREEDLDHHFLSHEIRWDDQETVDYFLGGGVAEAPVIFTRATTCTEGEKFMTPSRIFGNDGKPTDQFATDLIGKQVAKEAIDNRTKAAASAITGDALTLPDGGVVSASSSAPTITFGTARQDGLRFCELYITNPDTAEDGAIVSISGKVYSDVSLTELPKLDKGATYYFTFAEFKVTQETVEGETVSVSHWKVSKQKLDAMGGDIPTPTAA